MFEQLSIIPDSGYPYGEILAADPVRPNIPAYARIATNRECFVLHEGALHPQNVNAVLCAAYLQYIPTKEDDLWVEQPHYPDVCVFYSVWSNQKGSGKRIIDLACRYIRVNRDVRQVVTLSPKTEMATRFHESNGAKLYRINENSQNFMYPW